MSGTSGFAAFLPGVVSTHGNCATWSCQIRSPAVTTQGEGRSSMADTLGDHVQTLSFVTGISGIQADLRKYTQKSINCCSKAGLDMRPRPFASPRAKMDSRCSSGPIHARSPGSAAKHGRNNRALCSHRLACPGPLSPDANCAAFSGGQSPRARIGMTACDDGSSTGRKVSRFD
jgi:hypothetical protein